VKVVLAGFNTDREHGTATPETISAAYARISRDPRPVGQLRADAASEVEKARASNRTIVFEYGHGSIAEHAVFNFDVTGISRLATEALQWFRLASFTEKSQRYIRIGEDWHMPENLPPGTESVYAETVNGLFETYRALYQGLRDNGAPAETAKEDARYALPLATTSQMGMTVNARELEHMFRRFSAHPLAEVRELGELLHAEASSVAPSLFLFTEPSGMDELAVRQTRPRPGAGAGVLLDSSDGDSRVGAQLIQAGEGVSLERAARSWESLDDEARRKLFDSVYDSLGVHDAVPRSWETFRARFEVVISATAYAQLKRHRMSTQMVSRYDPGLGCTVPPSVERAGLTGLLAGAMETSRKAWEAVGGDAADYLLTNAHRRRVTLQMNGRELYHFSRLREDVHAQWDIRSIAGAMLDLVREAAPLTMKFAGGKSGIGLPGGQVE
jgi:flavin-dependent thymidylate synthase